MRNQAKIDVKICGLKTSEAVEATLDGGANYIGFIFFEKSPRHIELDQARALQILVAGRAKTVAVTVNADFEMLADIVETVKPDYLQLHGDETPERVLEIKARYGLPVIKAVAIRTLEDMEASKSYVASADMLLFDAKPPKGSELPGGNGVSFDWSLLQKFQSKLPIMLSGGLSRENIGEALSVAKPAGIDISSGVEIKPGVKDIGLISQFLSELNNYEY